MPLVWATRAKAAPNLLSLSRMRYFGPTPDEEGEERTEEKVSHGKKVARPALLGMRVNERPPGLSRWSCGAHSSHVLLNGAFRNVHAQRERVRLACVLLPTGGCPLPSPPIKATVS